MILKKCYCGSKLTFPKCCGLYIHKKKHAPTPEILMRSRYSAFCINHPLYLQLTWHPDTCPENLDLEESLKWIKLEIKKATASQNPSITEAQVEFRAYWIQDDTLQLLHERSLFKKKEGLWLYYSGVFLSEEIGSKKLSKNTACPCDSGKKYKNCHSP